MENMVIFKRNKNFMKLNESEIDEMINSIGFMKLYLLDIMSIKQKEQYKKELDNINDMLFSCLVEKYLKVQIEYFKNKCEYEEIDKIKTMEYYPFSKERIDTIDSLVEELK